MRGDETRRVASARPSNLPTLAVFFHFGKWKCGMGVSMLLSLTVPTVASSTPVVPLVGKLPPPAVSSRSTPRSQCHMQQQNSISISISIGIGIGTRSET